jgi:hypothetical protein
VGRRNQTIINYYYDKVRNKRIFSQVICNNFLSKIRMCIYTSRAAFVCDGQGERQMKKDFIIGCDKDG